MKNLPPTLTTNTRDASASKKVLVNAETKLGRTEFAFLEICCLDTLQFWIIAVFGMCVVCNFRVCKSFNKAFCSLMLTETWSVFCFVQEQGAASTIHPYPLLCFRLSFPLFRIISNHFLLSTTYIPYHISYSPLC